MAQLSQDEMYKLFQEFIGARTARRSVEGPDPNHRGVIDSNFVRPAPSEFPKMVYRADDKVEKGYVTRVVKSREEQDRLPKGWLHDTKEIQALLNVIMRAKNGESEAAA